MQPKEMQRLDPNYTADRGFAEFMPGREVLRQAVGELDEIVWQRGKPLTDPRLDLGLICQRLTLEDGSNDEAFMETWLLPPHDSFTSPDGTEVPSRFLVVDTRNPFNVNSTNPQERLRSYFLLIGNVQPTPAHQDPNDFFFPYYVVSERRLPGADPISDGPPEVPPYIFYVVDSPRYPLFRGGR